MKRYIVFVLVALLLCTAAMAYAQGAPQWFPFIFKNGIHVTSPKKGVVGATCEELEKLNANHSIAYNPHAGGCYYPMVKMPSQARAAVVETDVLLGFNEPDLATTMEEAVEAWPLVDTMCPPGSCLMGSPSPSQMNKNWIVEWVNAYREKWDTWPRFDFIGMHCHFQPGSVDYCLYLLSHYEKLSIMFSVPIWVTEVSCIPGVGYSIKDCQVAGEKMIDAMNASPRVDKWFWYTAHQDACWDSSVGFEQTVLVYRPCGRLSEMGKWLARQ
jgi:hypothetical protein